MSKPSSRAVPVILAGGSGTRLWPLSRADYPKQFLPIGSDRTLLQETVARGRGCCDGAPLVVASEPHRFLVAEQLAAMGERDATILLEPAARNTAPAIAAAAHRLAGTHPDTVMLVMPADHRIADLAAFNAAIANAVEAASTGRIVLLGIEPTRPDTGYGYVRIDGGVADDGTARVERFVEKPGPEDAAALIAAGDCYWNSGMFVFRASTFLEALARLEPDMHAASRRAVDGARADLDFLRLDAEAFEACRSVAVDVAVMERVDGARLVPFAGGWSDIGSWDAVHDAALGGGGQVDGHDTVAIGDALVRHCENSYVRAESRLVVALGLRNTIVIETPDALLVLDRDHAQDLKPALATLAANKRSELTTHQTCYRPWGHYESLIIDGRFQVKRITVKPGAVLSLQKHFHRAEHWVVVKGTAEVTRDQETLMLAENESVYLPLGCTHRMKNPGRIPLEIIEVQTGSYLGEDDIVRFDDEYGRG